MPAAPSAPEVANRNRQVKKPAPEEQKRPIRGQPIRGKQPMPNKPNATPQKQVPRQAATQNRGPAAANSKPAQPTSTPQKSVSEIKETNAVQESQQDAQEESLVDSELLLEDNSLAPQVPKETPGKPGPGLTTTGVTAVQPAIATEQSFSPEMLPRQESNPKNTIDKLPDEQTISTSNQPEDELNKQNEKPAIRSEEIKQESQKASPKEEEATIGPVESPAEPKVDFKHDNSKKEEIGNKEQTPKISEEVSDSSAKNLIVVNQEKQGETSLDQEPSQQVPASTAREPKLKPITSVKVEEDSYSTKRTDPILAIDSKDTEEKKVTPETQPEQPKRKRPNLQEQMMDRIMPKSFPKEEEPSQIADILRKAAPKDETSIPPAASSSGHEKESSIAQEKKVEDPVIEQKQSTAELNKKVAQPAASQKTPSKGGAPVAQPGRVSYANQPQRAKRVRQKTEMFPESPIDYSEHYKSFADIFSGSKMRDFDLLHSMRDVVGLFEEFDGIMNNPDLELQRKFKLSIAPLEMNPRDLVNNKKEVLEAMNPIEAPIEHEMYYKVLKTKNDVYDIVTRALLKRKGWTELPHGLNLRHTWNLVWSWSKTHVDFTKLFVWQRVNHFAQTKNFSRKDLLKRNVEKMTKIAGKPSEWHIMPTTFSLPQQYVDFSEAFTIEGEKYPDQNMWIMKPIAASRGRGISMVNDISHVVYAEPMIIQQYVRNPLLVDGFKFDLRIYVLITQFNPLEVFLYKEGFARMSTIRYTTNSKNIHNKYIHLTNSSIQKHNHNQKTTTADQIFGGTKLSLQQLRERIDPDGIYYDKMWQQITELVLKSLIAVQSEIPNQPSCFDMVGFDIIFDEHYKGWLIEINSSPSLARENYLDDLIKQQLLDDTIGLIKPMYFNKTNLVKVLKRRITEVQKGQKNVNTLNNDLYAILDGQEPRKYGELPEEMGNYECIAPSETYDKFMKIAYPHKYKE